MLCNEDCLCDCRTIRQSFHQSSVPVPVLKMANDYSFLPPKLVTTCVFCQMTLYFVKYKVLTQKLIFSSKHYTILPFTAKWIHRYSQYVKRSH